MAERTKAFYENKLRIFKEELVQAETEYDTYLVQTDATIRQHLHASNDEAMELIISQIQHEISEREKTVKQKQDSVVSRLELLFGYSLN
jgi:hypothetical protein